MLFPFLRCLGVAATILYTTSGVRADLLTGLTIDNRVVTFNSAAPGTFLSDHAITGGGTMVDIDYRPANGLLYGIASTGALFTIDPTTGAATLVGGGLPAQVSKYGSDFDPVADQLRVVNTADQNFRVNPNTGTVAATDTSLAYAVGDPNFGADPNVVGLAYTSNLPGPATSTLYGIDSGLDVLVTQDPANAGTLHTVAALGFNTTTFVGFDVSGTSGTAYASLTQPAGNFSQLFAVNLNTGATTPLGNIGNSSPFDAPLRGLAAPVGAVPEPSSLALVGLAGVGLAYLSRRGWFSATCLPKHSARRLTCRHPDTSVDDIVIL